MKTTCERRAPQFLTKEERSGRMLIAAYNALLRASERHPDILLTELRVLDALKDCIEGMEDDVIAEWTVSEDGVVEFD